MNLIVFLFTLNRYTPFVRALVLIGVPSQFSFAMITLPLRSHTLTRAA